MAYPRARGAAGGLPLFEIKGRAVGWAKRSVPTISGQRNAAAFYYPPLEGEGRLA